MDIKLEQAVNTRQKFKAEVEALELRIKELTAEIADLLDHAEGTTPVGDYSVNISRRRTLNKKKFTDSFPERACTPSSTSWTRTRLRFGRLLPRTNWTRTTTSEQRR